MATLTVDLPEHLARLVEDAVARGEYASESDVVRDALRLLAREGERQRQREDDLRRELQRGLADVQAGRFSTRSIADINRAIAEEDRPG